MVTDEIREELIRLGDAKLAEFQSKLTPTVERGRFLGIYTPELRKLAKQYGKRKDIDAFMNGLPHYYFEENQLHAFIISEMKDFDKCVAAVNAFLPFVDNWATCDQMSPKVFAKHRRELPELAGQWIDSGRTYTVRFGIGMLMEHLLGDDFDASYPGTVAAVRSDEYYVNMMIAWYFATALAKQYDAVLPYIEERRLDAWTHNKAIRKAIESRRISPEQKEYLRSLKIKG
ncbi:MAG: DNA alkylation repair protein [Clostridia bacterium]|nr:DNA alkylation repair protein [Clostridia bacterium]